MNEEIGSNGVNVNPAAEAVPVKLCVGIASLGRPSQVVAAVSHLRDQTLQPDQIIISCMSRDDVGDLVEDERLRIIEGRPGSSRQRNVVLDNLSPGTDYVVFFDDDFYPHRDWLKNAVKAFAADPRLACLTGNVIADGILGPGLKYDEAKRALEQASPSRHRWVIEDFSPYGCNMAFRCSAIASIRFDERLVLYGWLEDRDFGARVARNRGRLVKVGDAIGVHLGVKGGRVSGRRLGYSQVMNPAYLFQKRSMTLAQAANQVLRNVCKNAAKSFWQEAYIDRRGRLIGNLIATGDLLVGKLNPERAADL